MALGEHGAYSPDLAAADKASRRRSRTDLRQDDVVAKFKVGTGWMQQQLLRDERSPGADPERPPADQGGRR